MKLALTNMFYILWDGPRPLSRCFASEDLWAFPSSRLPDQPFITQNRIRIKVLRVSHDVVAAQCDCDKLATVKLRWQHWRRVDVRGEKSVQVG